MSAATHGEGSKSHQRQEGTRVAVVGTAGRCSSEGQYPRSREAAGAERLEVQ